MSMFSKAFISHFCQYLEKLGAGITGKHYNVRPGTVPGALGYTTENGNICVGYDPVFDLDREHQLIFVEGIFAHELMHQISTDFVSDNAVRNALPTYEQEIYADIANVMEDPAIENWASHYFGGHMLNALHYTIKLCYENAEKIETGKDPFSQWFTAFIQYGDGGMLVGNFTFPEAEEYFYKSLPYFDKCIEEPSGSERVKYFKEVFDLTKPLWIDMAKSRQQFEQLMEQLSKIMQNAGKNSMSQSSSQGDPNAQNMKGQSVGDIQISIRRSKTRKSSSDDKNGTQKNDKQEQSSSGNSSENSEQGSDGAGKNSENSGSQSQSQNSSDNSSGSSGADDQSSQNDNASSAQNGSKGSGKNNDKNASDADNCKDAENNSDADKNSNTDKNDSASSPSGNAKDAAGSDDSSASEQSDDSSDSDNGKADSADDQDNQISDDNGKNNSEGSNGKSDTNDDNTSADADTSDSDDDNVASQYELTDDDIEHIQSIDTSVDKQAKTEARTEKNDTASDQLIQNCMSKVLSDGKYRGLICNNIIVPAMPGLIEQYTATVAGMNGEINHLYHQLERIFKGDQEEKMYKGSGSLSIKRLSDSRMTARVFQKTHAPANKKNIAVEILMDISGSMSGDRIDIAKTTVIALTEVFEKFHIPVKLVAYTADISDHEGPVQFHLLHWHNTKAERASILSLFSHSTACDGFSIRYGAEELSERPEEHKLLIVLTDGEPNCQYYHKFNGIADTASAVRDAEKKVSVFGIAIGSDVEVLHKIYGTHFVHVQSLQDMFNMVGTAIRKEVAKW